MYIILNSILFGDFKVGILRSLNSFLFVSILIFLNQKTLKAILTTYSVSLLVFLFLFSFQSYLLGYEMVSKTAIINSVNLQTRLLLGFNHPGVLSLQVLSVSLIGLIFWKHKMLNFVLCFIFLLSTGSQNSLFGLLVFIVSIYRSSKKIFIYLVAFSLGLILIIGFGFDSINSISSGRLNLWFFTFLDNFSNWNVLVGTGYGNAVRPIYDSVFFSQTEVTESFHIDNYFLELIIEGGAFGFLVIITYILSIYKVISRSQHLLSFGLLNSLIFMGIFDSAFIGTGNVSFYFIWILLFYTLSIKHVDYKSLKM